MKKALEVLFGIREPNKLSKPIELSFSTLTPISRPGMLEWFKKYNVGILTDKQSTNVQIRMGNIIKYVDLRSIKSF
jgi:hypothetical protein